MNEEGQERRCEQLRPDADLLRQDLELVEELAGADPQVRLLQSLPGIGAFLGLVVRYEIDTIARFPAPQKLTSYAGLVPSTYASGGRVFHGRITKTGNRWLRWALVEAAWPAIRKSRWLRAFYERVKRQKGTNKAKVAVARKLCELVGMYGSSNDPMRSGERLRVALSPP